MSSRDEFGCTNMLLHDVSESPTPDAPALVSNDFKVVNNVNQLINEFRREADVLWGAQMHLADQQSVNQDHIVALFQTYAQTQVTS